MPALSFFNKALLHKQGALMDIDDNWGGNPR